MNNANVAQALLILLAIFIPLMFTFSKNLFERIGGKDQCDEKNKIIIFIKYSGVYFHCFAIFIIFQLLKIIISDRQEVLNFAYLLVFSLYIYLEYFEEDKKILLIIVSIFCVIPTAIWSWILVSCHRDMAACYDRNMSFIASILYTLMWFFLPVLYHPLNNLYKLLEKNGQ